MSTTIHCAENLLTYEPARSRQSAIARFFDWAEKQDVPYHIGWVGGSVLAMTAFFFPLTMAVVLMNGASFGLIIAAMLSLVLVAVSNLAAMSTKYTIPFLVLGIAIDLGVVILSFFVS
jgi:uncharacterized membrane protein (UPF0136 family)